MREAYALSACTRFGLVRALPGPQATHADLLQYGFKLRGVATLPGRDHDRHGFLALLDSQVQLGGQAAARATERLTLL